MKMIGVSDQLVDWTGDFLRNWAQTVTLQGTPWKPCHVSSGVPQGSVIGPPLLLYINDLPSGAKSPVRLFADDTIIYTTADKSAQLKEDLKSLEEWEKEWSMQFHPAKCEFIRFSRKRNKAQHPT